MFLKRGDKERNFGLPWCRFTLKLKQNSFDIDKEEGNYHRMLIKVDACARLHIHRFDGDRPRQDFLQYLLQYSVFAQR